MNPLKPNLHNKIPYLNMSVISTYLLRLVILPKKEIIMWPVSKFIHSIFIISCITICSAQQIPNVLIEKSPLKMYLVEDIVRKTCNISLNTFSNTNSEEKARLLEKIEEKLKKSAQALGIHGEKYVNLIMKGVKAKAFESNQTTDYKQATENKIVAENSNIDMKKFFRTDPERLPELKTDTILDSKDYLVHNIANNIELLAGEFLNKAKSEQDRQQIIENIKNTIVKSADRQHATPDEIKAYVALVSKGIELVVQRESIKRRRMEFVYTNNINLNKDSKNRIPDLVDPIKSNSLQSNELSRGVIKPKSVFLRIDDNTTSKAGSTCSSTLEEACSKIKRLKTLRCLSDNKEFNILQLCNGVGDCLDFSDEKECAHQAVEIIQTTNRLIADIDTSINNHHCSSDLLDKSMLSKQNNVLSEVLKNQLSFLRKHSESKTLSGIDKMVVIEETENIETIREAVNVVKSASALEMSLCSTVDKNQIPVDEEESEKETRQVSQSQNNQEICKCNGQNCLQKCSARCKRICLEMYSLTQFTCDSVSGDKLVSLDMVCDGKLDCFDELDEKDCSEDYSLAKFEATQMYDYVLKEIALKTPTISFEAVRSRFQNLHALVTKLQKLSLKRQPDVVEVKRIRQACFEELSKVYGSTLSPMKFNQDEVLNIRFFLVSLNERLVSALKRSCTGNDKIISSNGCVCRGNVCALPRCSKSCIRACSAEPQLTRFFCGEVSNQLNDSIPLELVCNKKANCPNGEDEKDCSKDVCRKHHLKLLRIKLKDVGKEYSGRTIGEILKSWRIKVTASLKIAEENDTPVMIYDILRSILHDLVMAYSAFEDRHNDTSIFNAFYLLSRVVINTLKSCRQ